MYQNVWKDVKKIRSISPLVHNITNYVVMNNTANALLSLGASPVMAHAPEEVEDMVGISNALVINIGTLSSAWIESMFKAMREAESKGIPIVLDPVGVGATPFRTQTALSLLQGTESVIIRGNASEIRALGSEGAGARGVDSMDTAEAALAAGRFLANQYKSVVSISGPTDIIISVSREIRVFNGHPMMPRVTGLGCSASALTGAFAAVNPDLFQAAAHAMAVMGLAGEMASEQAVGPGSMQLHFLDALYCMQETDIQKRLQMKAI